MLPSEGLPEQVLSIRKDKHLLNHNGNHEGVMDRPYLGVVGDPTADTGRTHEPRSEEKRAAGHSELQLLIEDLTRTVNNFFESRIAIDEAIQSRTYPRSQRLGNDLVVFNGLPTERALGIYERNQLEEGEVSDLVKVAVSFNILTQRLREIQTTDSAFDKYEPFYTALEYFEAFKIYSWKRARLIDVKSFACGKHLRPADLELGKVSVFCQQAVSEEAATLRKFAGLNAQHFPSPRTEHIFATISRIAEAWEPMVGKKHRIQRFCRWWNEDPRKYEHQEPRDGSYDGLDL
ncbi:hypothetical protein MMC10_009814 [Thelotrema lepadinum]|nr:hypothetical protein [Thelotrema lepadinum]